MPCHGLAAGGSQFTADARHFAAAGYRVLVPDLRAGPVHILLGGRDTAVNLALRPALKRIGERPNWAITHLPEGSHCSNLDATAEWRHAVTGFWSA